MDNDGKIEFIKSNKTQDAVCYVYNGYIKIFSVDPLFQLAKIELSDFHPIKDVCLLNKTNIIAIVGNSLKYPPSKVCLYDISLQHVLVTINVHSAIICLHLTTQFLVVMCSYDIFIFSINGNFNLIKKFKTTYNPKGISDVSSINEHLVFPGKVQGSAQIEILNGLDKYKSYSPIIITAHLSEISALAINFDGTLLATTSQNGTIIRLFSIETKKMSGQMRRGLEKVQVACLSFNIQSSLIFLSTNTQTVHIFSISQFISSPSSTNVSSINIMKNKSNSPNNMFDQYYSSIVKYSWSSANFYLPDPPVLVLCSQNFYIIALLLNGYIYKYSINASGHCNLIATENTRHIIFSDYL